jgi:hypothetical protein
VWIGSDSSRIHIPHGGKAIILLADSDEIEFSRDRAYELRVLEMRKDGTHPVAEFRWSYDAMLFTAIVEVSIVCVTVKSAVHKEVFRIEGCRTGGIRVLPMPPVRLVQQPGL